MTWSWSTWSEKGQVNLWSWCIWLVHWLTSVILTQSLTDHDDPDWVTHYSVSSWIVHNRKDQRLKFMTRSLTDFDDPDPVTHWSLWSWLGHSLFMKFKNRSGSWRSVSEPIMNLKIRDWPDHSLILMILALILDVHHFCPKYFCAPFLPEIF